MKLFDTLVAQALKNNTDIALLQPVVEKELLHHDILREMSTAGLLDQLTFIGGTCLRACYGSNRLSEDLDFTGGADFTSKMLQSLGKTLQSRLFTKYGLDVTVSEPKKEVGNVSTWKLRMITHPGSPNLPAQRIHIDICAIPSHDGRPTVLRNHYNVDMGTSGLILQAQSREEILADKILALALRPNRLKNRDIWDIVWLRQQGVQLATGLVEIKLKDRNRNPNQFLALLEERTKELRSNPTLHAEFVKEMQRFLPSSIANQTIMNAEFWPYLLEEVKQQTQQVNIRLTTSPHNTFNM